MDGKDCCFRFRITDEGAAVIEADNAECRDAAIEAFEQGDLLLRVRPVVDNDDAEEGVVPGDAEPRHCDCG